MAPIMRKLLSMNDDSSVKQPCNTHDGTSTLLAPWHVR